MPLVPVVLGILGLGTAIAGAVGKAEDKKTAKEEAKAQADALKAQTRAAQQQASAQQGNLLLGVALVGGLIYAFRR